MIALACLAAACTDDGAARSDRSIDSAPSSTSTTPAAPSTTTTTVPLPDPTPIAWAPCGDGFECSTTQVPVDYSDPSTTLELALIKRPADDPGRRIGTLVMNPGGPGASGVRRVRRGFTISSEVAERFDIVGFDPRGIGRSSPITCGRSVPAFRATDLAPDSPEESAALEAAGRAVAEECLATEGERLAHLGTKEVALDLEVIRRNLGEDRLSFVGLSYGTLIGLLWAEAFPTSVRALVLDGVSDPGALSTALANAQVAALERAFTEIEAACSSDIACPFTSPERPLLVAYDELAARIEAGEGSAVGVGPTQLAYAAFSATYDSDRWAPFWTALDRGLDGDLDGIASMADWFAGLVDYLPFALVTCLDAPHPQGFEAWQRTALDAAVVSPRFGAVAANELLPCAFWPASTRAVAPVSARGAPPILVVGTTGDVATPYAQAVRVAEDLESGVLLTVEGPGHVAIGDSSCAEAHVTRYLVDLAVPEPGTRCPG